MRLVIQRVFLVYLGFVLQCSYLLSALNKIIIVYESYFGECCLAVC